MDVYVRDLETGHDDARLPGRIRLRAGLRQRGLRRRLRRRATPTATEAFFVSEEQLTSDTDTRRLRRRLRARPDDRRPTKLVSAGGASCAAGLRQRRLQRLAARGLRRRLARLLHHRRVALRAPTATPPSTSTRATSSTATTSLVSAGGVGCVPACGNSGAVPIFQRQLRRRLPGLLQHRRAARRRRRQTPRPTSTPATCPAGPTILISRRQRRDRRPPASPAASADGRHVFFTTAERRVARSRQRRSQRRLRVDRAATLDLVTSAPCASALRLANFDAVSADSDTGRSSAPPSSSSRDDTDTKRRHLRAGRGRWRARPGLARGRRLRRHAATAPTTRASTEASADASQVVFTTAEAAPPGGRRRLARKTTSTCATSRPATTSLITTAPSYCPLKAGNCGATFVGSSADGLHVFFRTVERFTLDDGDNEADVYERFLGEAPSDEVTRLVSTGNDPDLELGPAAADPDRHRPRRRRARSTDPADPRRSRRRVGGQDLHRPQTAPANRSPRGTAAELARSGAAGDASLAELD